MANLQTEQLGELQQAFGLGAPVLVIGPGCHRIGYDSTTNARWQHAQCRAAQVWDALGRQAGSDEGADDPDRVAVNRRFLERLWLSQLSEETLAGIGQLEPGELSTVPGYELKGAVALPDGVPEEPAQVAVAVHLVRALVACTQFLGNVIEKGDTPVSVWGRVAGAGQLNDVPTLRVATRELELAGALAGALARARRSRRLPADDDTRRRHGDRVEQDVVENPVLKLEAIEASLKQFTIAHLVMPERPLTGSALEWLSDLLWHVLVSGTGVPMAQDELAFVVNLRQRADDPPGAPQPFARPRPGDSSGAPEEHKKIREDVGALLRLYETECGLAEPQWETPRQLFVATLAASLVRSWDLQQTLTAIALVTDYDLMFERALMAALEPKMTFHVVIPVWAKSTKRGDTQIKWICGTFMRGEEEMSFSEVSTSLTEPRQWCLLDASHPQARLGPVVIKLQGSPLHDSKTLRHWLAEQDDEEFSDAELAVIYSEFDSMRSVASLSAEAMLSTTDDSGSIRWALFNDLAWHRRSWLFFGHRFSDWLPRLRIFFMAQAQSNQSNPKKEPRPVSVRSHIAVDRSFGWPEIALLRALDVRQFEGDLAEVGDYAHDRTTAARADDKNLSAFLSGVQRLRQRIIAG